MAETIKRSSPSSGWEYRVQTIGSVFCAKDENIENVLNEWGERVGRQSTFTPPKAAEK